MTLGVAKGVLGFLVPAFVIGVALGFTKKVVDIGRSMGGM